MVLYGKIADEASYNAVHEDPATEDVPCYAGEDKPWPGAVASQPRQSRRPCLLVLAGLMVGILGGVALNLLAGPPAWPRLAQTDPAAQAPARALKAPQAPPAPQALPLDVVAPAASARRGQSATRDCGWLFDGAVRPTDKEERAFLTQSHAEEKEDVYLYQSYAAIAGRKDGIILESGAHDGLSHSQTLGFERHLGWTALHIEASPRHFKNLLHNRPESPTVKNFNAALCDKPRDVHWVDWRQGVTVSGIWEFMPTPFKAKWYPDIKDELVPHSSNGRYVVQNLTCAPLHTVLPPHIRNINIWILDVEGGELAVLQATDFSHLQFGIIVKETAKDLVHEAAADALLAENGYLLVERARRSSWYVNTCVARQFMGR